MNHPDYAVSLNNLAWLYACQGDYARAEPLYRQSLEISKKALGENHPDYAASLNNLAELYCSQGDYAQAGPLCLKSLAIKKQALGENHPEYAVCLGNLAQFYCEQGAYCQAEPLQRQALEIAKKALGEDHPEYARSLRNLAGIYYAQRDFARAEPLGRQALEITKAALGENHPEYADGLNNLAVLYEAQGDYARAEPLLRQAVVIRRRQLESTAVVQSERQQLAMLQSVRSSLDHYLSLTAGQDQPSPQPSPILSCATGGRGELLSASAYQQMLAWKGIVFRRQRLACAGVQTPELAALFRQLQQVAGQLAQQAWATPDPKHSAHWRENIERLSTEKDRLEAELSAHSAAYRQAQKQITLEELQQALPNDAVLVDFLQNDHVALTATRAGTEKTRQQRLIAFVVRHEGPVLRINLGPARPLNDAIDTWRESFGISPASAAAGKLLREKLWDPIDAHIQDARIVLVSPDGPLNRLPLAALPGKKPDTFLLEERAIALVPVAQMIPEIVQAKASRPLPGNLLLVGNINYDAQPGPAEVAQADGPASTRSLPAGSMHFQPLQGTRDEVAAIEKLYRHELGTRGIRSLQESQATKATVLAEAGKYRYLHLATHGFFIEEKLPVPVALAQRGAERFRRKAHGTAGRGDAPRTAFRPGPGRRQSHGPDRYRRPCRQPGRGHGRRDCRAEPRRRAACHALGLRDGTGQILGGRRFIGASAGLPVGRGPERGGQPVERARRGDADPHGNLLHQSLAAASLGLGVVAAGAVGHAPRHGQGRRGAGLPSLGHPAQNVFREAIPLLLGRLRPQRRLAVRVLLFVRLLLTLLQNVSLTPTPRPQAMEQLDDKQREALPKAD